MEEFNLDEISPPIVTMADQRTMAQLLQAPTKGYEDAIVIPAITADNFKLKNGHLTLVQNKHNTIAIMRSDLKVITTRSGVSYDGPQILPVTSFLPKVVENEPEAAKDTVNPTNNRSTEDVQPQEDFSAYVKANDAVMRIMQTQGQNMQNQLTNLTDLITKFVNSNSSFTSSSCTLPSNTIAIMRSDLKVITTRSSVSYDGPQILPVTSFLPKVVQSESLILTSEPVTSPISKPVIASISAPKHNPKSSIPYPSRRNNERNRDPGKFLIPCDFSGMAECLALADLGASINLMSFSVWKRLYLPKLTPMCMTLGLADRLISRPVGVAEDVYVKVGSFHFPADFVVVDFDADPQVPLSLRRSFLKTGRALIDVFEGELTFRVGKDAITFNLHQISRYSAIYSDIKAKQIDFINMACDEYSQEVLGFFDTISSGNPTSFYDSIVFTTSPTLTLFENSDFLLEEVDAFLAIEDDPTSPEFYQPYLDPEGTYFF
nr:reverse transcriptase domain-containing protein [Tanacetum cinerariifolium]